MAVKRKCRVCGEEYERVRFGQVVCSPKCGVKYAAAQKDKAIKAADAKAKREAKADLVARKHKLETLPELTKKTQTACNAYIRLRDLGKPCISCCKPLTGAPNSYDAGHYRSRAAAPHLRFDERNIHGQCKHCNQYLSGNVVEYRKGLIERIGIDVLEELESDNTTRHFRHDDLRAMKADFDRKRKELEAERG